ncbi:MAG: VTT domain-containing protein [Armatimonadetes bacterium]|nr:VTT domain-containing protein [Armatimonadota bacterium]
MGSGMHHNLEELITTVGYVGLFLIVFAESGLFFGFFLPGDSLLLTCGLLASRGILDIYQLLPVLFVAAVTGDQVGYWFGAKTGPLLFNRPNSLLFRRENLLKAKAFYDQHGGKTITLARFMPFIRTFAPIVAGACGMNYRSFVFFNLFGGALWAIGLTWLGWYLGVKLGTVEGIDRYFMLLVLAFFFIPGLPALHHVLSDLRERRRAARASAEE